MVQSACQCVEAYRFGRASNISGYDKMTFSGYFVHFGLKIGPFYHWNLTKTPWDYKSRAQELTRGAIRMLLSFFAKIWEHFKDGRVSGLFYRINLGVNLDIFYNFWYILAMDGPKWIKLVIRFFDALTKYGKIFDRYDPQSFWETVEVGAKNYLSS